MVNWKSEYKGFVMRKYEEIMGKPLSAERIIIRDVLVEIDISLCSINELVYMYAFAVMKEDFEYAEKLKNILAKKNCEIKIDINDKERIAIVNAYIKPEMTIASINIKMKVLRDGLMIDFEDEVKPEETPE